MNSTIKTARIEIVSSEPKWLHEAINYMAENFSDEIKLDEVANAVGISKFTFCRQFHRYIGITPAKWLRNFRIYIARELLLLNENGLNEGTVEDIAFASGFSNSAHFCRLFKLECGVTPTEFRETSQKAFLEDFSLNGYLHEI